MKITEEMKVEIFKLRKSGLSQRAIANELEIPKYVVGYILNPEIKKRRAKSLKKYYEENKEKKSQQRREYRKTKEGRDKARKYDRDHKRLKRKSNPIFALIGYQRCRINAVLKDRLKTDSTLNLLGCTSEEFKLYLESKFLPGMNWENYGKLNSNYLTWNVDHIRACATFDLSDPEQQKICFHYTNLQPLWAIDNLRYGAKDKFKVLLENL